MKKAARTTGPGWKRQAFARTRKPAARAWRNHATRIVRAQRCIAVTPAPYVVYGAQHSMVTVKRLTAVVDMQARRLSGYALRGSGCEAFSGSLQVL